MNDSIYEFSVDDARRFAREQGARTKQSGNELIFSTCPYCHGGTNHDKATFAINLITGQFNCKRSSCDIHGNMITLAKDFNFELSSDVSRYLGQGQYNRSRYRSFGTEHIESKDAAVEFMKSRGISEEITKRYEITARRDDESTIVFPFRDDDGVMRFIKYRNTKAEKIEKYGKEHAEKGGKPILFGIPQCNPNNEHLILTEGQIDALSVAEAGFENAVSVPTGANGSTWIPHCWDWLTQYKDIIVFGDYERGEISLLEMVKRRFHNSKTIYHVRPEDYKDCKDANDLLRKYGKDQIATCINNAVPVPVEGLEDIVNIKISEDEYTKFETGIYPLDRFLRGGLPTGIVTLLNGRTGEGKSCFAHQIALHVASQGQTCMIYSGELPMREVKKQIMKQAAGAEFIDTEKNQYGDNVYKIRPAVFDKIDQWLGGKIYLYNTEITQEHREFEDLTLITRKAIIQYGVRFIVIDNLMTAIDLTTQEAKDKYSKQGEFVNKLAEMAKEYDVAILLVAHRRKSGAGGYDATDNEEVSGSSHIANLVGLNIFYGRGNKEEETGRKDKNGNSKTRTVIDNDSPLRYIKITKNRLDGRTNLDGIEVEYDEPSNRIYYAGPKEHNNRDRVYGWNMTESIETFVDADDLKIPF